MCLLSVDQDPWFIAKQTREMNVDWKTTEFHKGKTTQAGKYINHTFIIWAIQKQFVRNYLVLAAYVEKMYFKEYRLKKKNIDNSLLKMSSNNLDLI